MPGVPLVSKVLEIRPRNLATLKVIIISVVTIFKEARLKDWKYCSLFILMFLSDQKMPDMRKPACQVTKHDT